MNAGALPRWTAPGPEVARPEDGAVHLWEIQESPDYADTLPPSERARHDGISCPATRIGYASSQGGLRRIVAAYLRCPAENLVLGRREHGKPFVAGGPEFNLSHTAGRVLAVFSREDIGLDIEAVSRKVNAIELARKFFLEHECAALAALEPAARNAAFLRYWVCKEATVKLSGDGIFRGLREAGVELSDGEFSHGDYRGRRVWIREIRPAPDLLGAIASWKPFSVKGFFRV